MSITVPFPLSPPPLPISQSPPAFLYAFSSIMEHPLLQLRDRRSISRISTFDSFYMENRVLRVRKSRSLLERARALSCFFSSFVYSFLLSVLGGTIVRGSIVSPLEIVRCWYTLVKRKRRATIIAVVTFPAVTRVTMYLSVD